MNRIGATIRLLRDENKMSQKALAKKLGVSESFINEVEEGRKVVSESIIVRVSKIFGKNIDDISIYDDKQEEVTSYEAPKIKTKLKPAEKKEIVEVWDEAFGSILKNVPVYNMDMKTVLAVKQLPIISNKIEGFPQDKVFFLKIEDNDMHGFRIYPGDVAFAHISQEVKNDAICLIQYDKGRVIRQIKKLDNNKILLVSNSGSVRTETANVKDVKVIARLTKLEIIL